MPGANSELRVFVPLTKIDIEKRLVFGLATAQEPDLSGEVCDYATTKPYYEAWSADVHKKSGGKSVGNLRAMHGNKAAGKVVDIAFDDDARKIEICAKVVDDNEWQKVQEGVYTGFSQGGKYVKRWDDEASGLTYYTADPTEISLVDLPCLPTATFSVVKAANAIEKRAFVTVIDEPDPDAIKTAAEALAARDNSKTWREFAEEATSSLFKAAMRAALDKCLPIEKKDYSTEERKGMADKGEALPDGSYPIKTAKDVENAVADFGRANGSATDKAHIVARAKAIGCEDCLPDDWTGGKAAEKRFEPENKWDCGCADHKHLLKHEAVTCMKKRAAEAVPSPVDVTLAKLEEELGLAKAKPAPPTAAEIAAAHHDAADAHRGAAELHEAMAAKDNTSADDAEEHLTAAAAHRRAAKAHDRAADMNSAGDAGAEDASKKAGKLTHDAAAKSDAMFIGKLAPADLQKYNDAEARDPDGRWTGGGAAADEARAKAESVTHALASTAVSMGVGEVGARVGSAIGAKVGHYAGKALAMVSGRAHPLVVEAAGETGKKVGSVAGGILGRMYAEARTWHAIAGKMRKDAGADDGDQFPSPDDDPTQWDSATEHGNAAAAHRRAASSHMDLAGATDTPADAADAHLLAAKANLLAAQKHGAAVGGDADSSSMAKCFTDSACDASMGALGLRKSTEVAGLAKDVSDEPRDSNGEWTVGGIAAAAARTAIGAGTGFLVGDVPGAVAGGIGGAMSDSALGAAASGLTGGALGRAAGSLIGSGARMAANSAVRAEASKLAEKGSLDAAKAVLRRGMGASHPAVYAAARDTVRAAARAGKMAKDLGTVGRLLSVIQDLYWVQQSMQWEAEGEGDGSPLPDALKTAIEGLSEIAGRSLAEESSELFKPGSEPDIGLACARMSEGDIAALTKFSKGLPALEKLGEALEATQGGAVNRTIERFVAEVQALVKIGARNSQADASRLQQAHDLLSDLGAKCGGEDDDDEGNDDVDKLKAENSDLRDQMTKLDARLGAVLEKVTEFGKRAAPAKAVLRSIEKGADGPVPRGARATLEAAKAALDALPEADRAMVLMKLSLDNPVRVIA